MCLLALVSRRRRGCVLLKAKWKTKYGNVKAKLDGHLFDSRKEAKRYRDLLLLEAAGEISHLELQPRYVLWKGRTIRGERLRAITYTADFRYQEGGRTTVEDVKSTPTRRKTDYVIRKKLFMGLHPEIVFKET